MNKKDLIKAISEDIGMPQTKVSVVVDSLFDTVANALVEGNEVNIPKFGRFYAEVKEEYTARNPKDGSKVIVPSHNIAKFKYSSVLKENIK